jgi:hypothetical protein
MSLKPLIFVATAIGAVALYGASVRHDAQLRAALTAEAAAVTRDYGATLLGALKSALESAGTVGAVAFCHDQAPEIAAEASRQSGWRVARTSLKPRNATSAPDSYDRRVMEDFAARIAEGAPAAELSRTEIVDSGDGREFRFVKAIPTAELCLACHGTEVKGAVRAKIDALYPDDRATGFKVGDMRGVFTLRKRL